MSRTRKNWNSDKLLGLSAISISFITLVIFIYQTNIMSRQNYISIMPYLDISTTRNTADHIFEVNLKNHGMGPAIIESVALIYQEKRYNLADYGNNLFAFLASKAPKLDSIISISASTLDKGMAIPANSVYNVFGVRESRKDYQLMTEALDQLLANGLDYEIIYKSIQDERWRLHNNSDGPEKLD
ncbi:MAG: hypothetical protein H6573_28935 [Lewinellaceae bacterium]|nr:hypothetical protein [Phaeodactylibacter sp.]MCB0613535.1 hypothetical protein [Phaeodactylibacter sp.]MCB9351492.1 hypothetical protein [Lewinellaceae bacterium]